MRQLQTVQIVDIVELRNNTKTFLQQINTAFLAEYVCILRCNMNSLKAKLHLPCKYYNFKHYLSVYYQSLFILLLPGFNINYARVNTKHQMTQN